jgi:hypothetical protein
VRTLNLRKEEICVDILVKGIAPSAVVCENDGNCQTYSACSQCNTVYIPVCGYINVGCIFVNYN